MLNGKKILVASVDYLIQSGMASFISEFEGELVGVSVNQKEIELKSVEFSPDVVIIQKDSSDFNIDKSLAFLSIVSDAKVVLICSDLVIEEQKQLIKNGVKGFVSNAVSKESLLDLFKFPKERKFFCDEKIVIEDMVSSQADSFKTHNISEREGEIIKLIAEGYINKEIADRLFLSTHTVNTHRKNIMSKLGISNTAGIVMFAVKQGLVSMDDFLFSSKEH